MGRENYNNRVCVWGGGGRFMHLYETSACAVQVRLD